MVDICLVDPPVSSHARLGRLNKVGGFWPSLGLGFLAAVARQEGFSVGIVDSNTLNLSSRALIKKIIIQNPKIVGISATTLTIDTAGKIAAKLKAWLPSLTIVVGGAHITAVPKKTLQKYKSIDVGVIGEGEETFKELLLQLSGNGDLSKVAGIVYRQKGRAIVTEARPFIKDLDRLPLPAWDLFPDFPKGYKPAGNTYRQTPAAHLFTSRGCTGQCLFCDRSVFGRYPRMHSAKRVLEMIRILVNKYGIKEIQFYDDNMVLFPKRLEQICKGLTKNGYRITWTCQARADMLDDKKLRLMKRAGCWQIGLGIESGSDLILNMLQKGETKQQLIKAVKQVRGAGIEAKGYFILGSPGESKASLKETLEMIMSTPFTYVHTTFFTPYPGSAAYTLADKFGCFRYKNDWLKIGRGTVDAIFVPYGLTKKDLQQAAAEIYRKFYFRPAVFFYHLKKILFSPGLWVDYGKGAIAILTIAKNDKLGR